MSLQRISGAGSGERIGAFLRADRCREDDGDECFLRAVPDGMCIRMVEEVRELHIPLSLHSSFYEASSVAMDGGRRYSLRDLIKVCLAQRVDLLCVGEVRGEEAYELTRAVNAGCPVLTKGHG